MRTITTRVAAYATDNDVADAVMGYSLALTRCRQVDLVEIPFRGADGSCHSAVLRVGWMVDIDAVSESGVDTEWTHDDFVAEIHRRERVLEPHGDAPFDAEEIEAWMSSGDF
jgi:hypothetical protein